MFPDYMMGFNDMCHEVEDAITLQLSSSVFDITHKLAIIMMNSSFCKSHMNEFKYLNDKLSCLNVDLFTFRRDYPKYKTVKNSGRLVQQKYWLGVMQMCSSYCYCAELLDNLNKIE